MAKLPIESVREEIVKSVKDYDTIIINASTGSGKTTQIPQYLYYEGFRVIIVEPRPIEAISGYNRLLQEMNLEDINDIVGCRASNVYKNVKNNKILFCTGGIGIIKKIESDTEDNLVLIIDEVHEWKLSQETLVGWVNAYRKKGGKLKVVLMSATVDGNQLKEFFSKDGSVIDINLKRDLYPIEEYNYSEFNLNSLIRKHTSENHSCLCFCTGKGEIKRRIDDLEYSLGIYHEIDKVNIYALHGQLSFEDQQAIFEETEHPKVIFCTNIAQSGITPPVDVVFDNLKEKTVFVENGVDVLKEIYISKADQEQRKGRAGRLGPGFYYKYDDGYPIDNQRDYPVPEIQRTSLDKFVLELMSIGLNPMDLEFFHQPSKELINESINLLETLGAIKGDHLTSTGIMISKIPTGVRYGKIICEADRRGCMADVIIAVAIMNTGSVIKDNDIEYFEYSSPENYLHSDVLAEIEIYKKYKKHKFEKAHPGTFSRKNILTIDRIRRSLEFSIKNLGMDPYTRTENNIDILKCIFKGFLDSLISAHYMTDSYGYLWGLSSKSHVCRNFDKGIIFGLRKEFLNKWHSCNRLMNMASFLSFEDVRDVLPDIYKVEKI